MSGPEFDPVEAAETAVAAGEPSPEDVRKAFTLQDSPPPAPGANNGARRAVIAPEALDRSPPHDLDAELNLLGEILHGDGAGRSEELHRVLALLSPADFYGELHGAVFGAMAALIEDGREVSPTGVLLGLGARNLQRQVVGELLLRISDRSCTSANLEPLARRIRELARQRRVRVLVARAGDALVDGAEPAVARLRAGIEELEAEASTEPTADVLTLEDLRRLDDRKGPQPLIGAHVLDEGGLGVMASSPAAGKSNLALDLGLCLARGASSFLGLSLPPAPKSVLYWWLESNRFRAKSRTADQARDGESLPDFHLFAPSAAGPDIMGSEGRALADGQLRHFRPALWILDTLSAAAPGLDENDNVQVKQLLHWLAGLRRRHGVAVLVLHHTRKQQAGRRQTKGDAADIRGVSALLGEADCVLRLDRDGGEVLASWGKLRDCPALPALVLSLKAGRFEIVGERAPGRPGKARESVLQFLEESGGAIRSYEAIEKGTGCKRRTIERVLLEDLVPAGLVERVADCGQGAFFRVLPKASV